MSNPNESTDTVSNVLRMGEVMKMFGGWAFGAIALVVSVVFWIQSQGNDKYYPKIAGENLEKQLVRIEQHMDSFEAQNIEIIRILERLEQSTLCRSPERSREF